MADPNATATNSTQPSFLRGYKNKQQIAAAFCVSQRTIERWVRLRQFPKPAKIGNVLLWREDSIVAHLDTLATATVDHRHSEKATTRARRR